MKDSIWDYWWIWVIFIVFAIIFLLGMYNHVKQSEECDAVNGVLVRTGSGYTCVDPKVVEDVG